MKIENPFTNMTQLLKPICLLVLIGSLTACGTMNRSASKKFVYRGLDQTHEPIDACWQQRFGCLMAPIVYPIVWISYPIDFAIDTLLYPIDKTWEISRKSYYWLKYPVIEMRTYVINLDTHEPMFYVLSSEFYGRHLNGKEVYFTPAYRAMLKKYGVLIEHETLSLPIYNNTNVTKVTQPEPSKLENVNFSLVWGKNYIDEAATNPKWKEHTLYYKYIIPLSVFNYNSSTQFATFVFLPCHQVQLHFFTSEEEMRKEVAKISNSSKQMNQLEQAGNCPPLQENVKLHYDSRN